MTTLGIYTVKKLCKYNGVYFTYGGFGEYLTSMRTSFDHVILVAHVKNTTPPHGYYALPPGKDLEVVHLPQVRSELGTYLTMPIVLWRAWKAAGYMDIAHARMPNHTGIIGALVCRIRGVPVFCQVIADWFIEAHRMPIFRKYGLGLLMKVHLYCYDFLERLICRRQLVFAQGQTCYDKHRFHSDCNLVLSTSHHIEDVVEPAPRFFKVPYVILTVARLTSVKNHELILRSLAYLRSIGKAWCAVFVGEGPQRAHLESLVKELNLQNHVKFVGQVQRGKQLWQYFDEADCFVLSSRSEGTAKVLLEAMARGLPVIASDVAGIPTSVKHEDRGLLFKDNDPNDLAQTLQRLALDHELRTRIVNNGREFCIAHTVEHSTERMLAKVFKRWPYLKKTAKVYDV